MLKAESIITAIETAVTFTPERLGGLYSLDFTNKDGEHSAYLVDSYKKVSYNSICDLSITLLKKESQSFKGIDFDKDKIYLSDFESYYKQVFNASVKGEILIANKNILEMSSCDVIAWRYHFGVLLAFIDSNGDWILTFLKSLEKDHPFRRHYKEVPSAENIA